MSTNDFPTLGQGQVLSTLEPAMSTPQRCTAVGYIRVSTGKQDCSMEVQEERIQQYCKADGLELVEILREPAVSAANVKLAKRPVGSQVATGTFLSHTPARHIVALKLDRLFRNAVDALTHVEEWEKAGIHFHLVDFGGQAVNSSTPNRHDDADYARGFCSFLKGLDCRTDHPSSKAQEGQWGGLQSSALRF